MTRHNMKALLTRLFRRKHNCRNSTGRVEVWTARCGKIMSGFRCDCGTLHHIHPTGITSAGHVHTPLP